MGKETEKHQILKRIVAGNIAITNLFYIGVWIIVLKKLINYDGFFVPILLITLLHVYFIICIVGMSKWKQIK